MSFFRKVGKFVKSAGRAAVGFTTTPGRVVNRGLNEVGVDANVFSLLGVDGIDTKGFGGKVKSTVLGKVPKFAVGFGGSSKPIDPTAFLGESTPATVIRDLFPGGKQEQEKQQRGVVYAVLGVIVALLGLFAFSRKK